MTLGLAVVGGGSLAAQADDPDHDGLTTWFELHQSRTDPGRADTDHDGTPDGAEDPDGDGLSNAGEQRYGTDARRADTDGDGTDDWHEDSNGDGRPDGLTQDARPVPPGLRPPLADPADRPRSWYECHQGAGHTSPRVCVVGTKGPKVVLFGDSHALQWRGALERIAKGRRWRVYFLTKSGCPVATIALPSDDCAIWRQRALARIKSIHPAMVIASNMDLYAVVGEADAADGARLWRKGLTTTLRTLKRSVPKVVLLGDTPRWVDAATCLPDHLDDMSACALRRSMATDRTRIASDRAAASAASVNYVRTIGLSCPYDPCPPVIGRLLVAYDTGHMTVAFSSTLWRGLERILPRP